MKDLKRKECDIVLISHTDLDGYGSEIVLRAFGFNPKVYHLENHEVDSFLDRYLDELLTGKQEMPKALYITDLSANSVNAEKLDKLYHQGLKNLHLFDHHLTALFLNEYPWANVLIEKDGRKECGTSLFYNHLIDMGLGLSGKSGKTLECLVEHIRLYDTWEWESEGKIEAKYLNDLFYLEGPDLFMENRIEQIKSGDDNRLWNDFEEQLLKIERERINRYLEKKDKAMIVITNYFMDQEGTPLTAGVVQADQYISELGHYLCDNHPEIDFALMIKLTENKVSLRASKDEVDLTPIAKQYEGGGHKHAAGCKLSAMGKEFLELVYAKIDEK